MELIDWAGVARNALWILGLALAFAAASHANWRASLRGEPLGRSLGQPAFLVPVSAGLLLVTASLAWGAAFGWERGLWAVASGGFLWHIVVLLRERRVK